MKFVKIFVLFGMIRAGSLSRKRRDLIGWNRGINNSLHNTPSYYSDPTSEKKDLHFQYIAHMARNGLNKQQRELLRAHLAQYTATVQPVRHTHRFKHFTSRH